MIQKFYRNITKKDYRYYRTTNIYLAAYLYAHNLQLVNVDKANPKRCVFVFRDTPERESLESRFLFGKGATVDAVLYAQAIRELKTKIHDRLLF
ncbi:MAG TPA: DUF5659 domain-containing protein [Thermodesulfobacteriota bacterium]|nr:DUF5659 domain-containing protein [Thermodesulfobacteriota bacterium]